MLVMIVGCLQSADNYIVNLDAEFDDKRPQLVWGEVIEYTFIYETKQFITSGGNPVGGYVYFCNERHRAWRD